MRKFILPVGFISICLTFLIPQQLMETKRQQILAATIMITIRTPNWQQKPGAKVETLPIPPDDYRQMARAEGEMVSDGLGTLITEGSERLLVTHDHWSHFNETLGTVIFRDARGNLLGEMDLRAFKALVRLRDGGVMVLSTPSFVGSKVGASKVAWYKESFHPGDTVLLAKRVGDKVQLSQAQVKALGNKQGRAVARLQVQNGQRITGGDSGGGVWFNGRLAGTMWTTVMLENPSSGQRQATDLSVAAIYLNNDGR